MKEHGAKAYLVNTGWNGTGKRISLKDTRAIIDSIIDGSIDEVDTIHIPIMNLNVPKALKMYRKAFSTLVILTPMSMNGKKKQRNWLVCIGKTLSSIAIMTLPKHLSFSDRNSDPPHLSIRYSSAT